MLFFCSQSNFQSDLSQPIWSRSPPCSCYLLPVYILTGFFSFCGRTHLRSMRGNKTLKLCFHMHRLFLALFGFLLRYVSILAEEENTVLILKVSPQTWSTHPHRCPLQACWLKWGDFQMQGVKHHHAAGSGLGLHALSLSQFQKAMRMPLLVCSPAERSKTTCASRDIQQKKAREGSSYALSSRAFTCPN